MEKLTEFKSQRSVLKSNLTKFTTAFNIIKVLPSVDKPSMYIFQEKLKKAQRLLDDFCAIQLQIEQLKIGDFQIDNVERESFEDTFYIVTSGATIFVEEYVSKQATASQAASTSGKVGEANETTNDDMNVRLPAIELPKFSGAYENWIAFHDSFVALVHENRNLSDVKRLHYLKSCLSGEAENLIESIETTAANYKIAWDLLLERFDNKRILINKHIAAIFDLPSQQRESAVALRNIVESLNKNLRCLKNLGQSTEGWDAILVFIISGKLDATTAREWEVKCGKELPKVDALVALIRTKCEMLDTLRSNSNVNNAHKINATHLAAAQNANKPNACAYCQANHAIWNCHKFLALNVQDRHSSIRRLRLCYKCFRDHPVAKCRAGDCKLCKRPHHMLLHYNKAAQEITNVGGSTGGANQRQNNQTNSALTSLSAEGNTNSNIAGGSQTTGFVARNKEVLLSTAVVNIDSKWGDTLEARCLLDNGAQGNFITTEMCEKIGAKTSYKEIKIQGINGITSDIYHSTTVIIKSRLNSYKYTVECAIVPKITEHLPAISFPRESLSIPANIGLADPSFNMSQGIDILLGADPFYDVICHGLVDLGPELPKIQNTLLGYVVGGKISNLIGNNAYSNHCIIHSKDEENIECAVSALWKDEIVSNKRFFSEEEQLCESHFINTVQRSSQGRFIVTIPCKDNLNKLGKSRSKALNRFYNLERKLAKNHELKIQYSQFMREYLSLGHMREISENDERQVISYYIPHHPVINENSSTTKLRVVFDASMKADSGISLNDTQMVGPTIQTELFDLLIQFRQHKIVLAADITQMYRQVEITENQRCLQRIFWREESYQPLKCFELNTVTYGMAASAFLAIRCLSQVGTEFAEIYPQAAAVIKSHFYVDDLLTGAETVTEAVQLRDQLQLILETAGFHLRKWNSNDRSVLSENEQLAQPIGDDAVKTLGIWWNAKRDTLAYKCNIEFPKIITKRSILSTTAKMFDPFGLLCPVVIKAKFIIQTPWQLNKGWDDPLAPEINEQWLELVQDLGRSHEIEVPRRALVDTSTLIEMHGFCDASERGYGACVYFRGYNETSGWKVQLVCAKAKVSPLKTVNLPRLELNSAVLLSRLITRVRHTIVQRQSVVAETLWSDSMVALSWIKSSPHRWKTYVANRVAEIQENTMASQWRHVKSESNPADVITRGTLVTQLKFNSLWWAGPPWLIKERNEWPVSNHAVVVTDVGSIEERPHKTIINLQINHISGMIETFSSFFKLIRVTAYCLRFINNARQKTAAERVLGRLSSQDLNFAEEYLIRQLQGNVFSAELKQLKAGNTIKNSKIVALAPFVGTDGILRVGGRLQRTNYIYSKRHPILLPQKHAFTSLLTRELHIKNLHCGPQALLAIIREKYWPIGGRSVVRQMIHKCITCFKAKPTPQTTITGQLPEARASQAPVFYNVGVDFAGPFIIKDKRSRGNKDQRVYICLFICLAVKAIHLELVSDLSTEGFLAALRRFIARRGKPQLIMSDNATNFVGARNELQRFLKCNSKNLNYATLKEGIDWKYIPPRAPHFGGIWEAAVKSVKSHLKRILGNAHLVYEELYTVLTQVEAVLNSRPLCTLSNDPNDLSALTPAHFLIGRTLTAAPDLEVTDVATNRLSRYQRVQQLQQHFWSRWSREYINNLQQRPRTRAPAAPAASVQEGALVIIREDGQPPLTWPMGRIVQVHPGKDGEVRVVSVHTNKGIFKREVRKICVLPMGEH